MWSWMSLHVLLKVPAWSSLRYLLTEPDKMNTFVTCGPFRAAQMMSHFNVKPFLLQVATRCWQCVKDTFRQLGWRISRILRSKIFLMSLLGRAIRGVPVTEILRSCICYNDRVRQLMLSMRAIGSAHLAYLHEWENPQTQIDLEWSGHGCLTWNRWFPLILGYSPTSWLHISIQSWARLISTA